MSTPTSDEHQQLNNNKLFDESTFYPWQTFIRGRSTCTVNAYDIQQLLRSKNKTPITRKKHSKSTT